MTTDDLVPHGCGVGVSAYKIFCVKVYAFKLWLLITWWYMRVLSLHFQCNVCWGGDTYTQSIDRDNIFMCGDFYYRHEKSKIFTHCHWEYMYINFQNNWLYNPLAPGYILIKVQLNGWRLVAFDSEYGFLLNKWQAVAWQMITGFRHVNGSPYVITRVWTGKVQNSMHFHRMSCFTFLILC